MNDYEYAANPNYYIGDGLLKEIRRFTTGFGKRYLIVTQCGSLANKVVKTISDSLNGLSCKFSREHEIRINKKLDPKSPQSKHERSQEKIEYKFLNYDGVQATFESVVRLSEDIKAFNTDVLVAVGGGTVMDVVRAANFFIDQYDRPKFVIVPTMVCAKACDAPLSVIDREDGSEAEDMCGFAHYPDAVIADTGVIQNTPVRTIVAGVVNRLESFAEIVIDAPVRAIVAGIGHQLGACVESICVLKEMGEYETCDRISRKHLEACIEVLKTFASEAVADAKQKVISFEFELVLSACAYANGPDSKVSFTYLTHLLDEALLEFEPVRKLLHGEVVGYGILPLLVYFGMPEEIYPYVDIFVDIGIPVNLQQLGLGTENYESILWAYKRSQSKEFSKMSPVKFAAEDMAKAVMEADRLVNEYLANQG